MLKGTLQLESRLEAFLSPSLKQPERSPTQEMEEVIWMFNHLLSLVPFRNRTILGGPLRSRGANIAQARRKDHGNRQWLPLSGENRPNKRGCHHKHHPRELP